MNKTQTLASAAIAASLLLGITACAAEDQPAPAASPASPSTAISGVTGAAHFDDGYLQIGSGPKVVDIYVDPMCPFCKMFEEQSGPMLLSEATAGTATLRVHPVAILNRLSQGSDYSTRAAASLTAVAATSPENLPGFLTALYADQPEENTPGLTDSALVALAEKSGAHEVSAADIEKYSSWVDAQTAAASTGPLPTTTEIRSITQVPTVIVNGAVFGGNSSESAAFAAFYASH